MREIASAAAVRGNCAVAVGAPAKWDFAKWISGGALYGGVAALDSLGHTVRSRPAQPTVTVTGGTMQARTTLGGFANWSDAGYKFTITFSEAGTSPWTLTLKGEGSDVTTSQTLTFCQAEVNVGVSE